MDTRTAVMRAAVSLGILLLGGSALAERPLRITAGTLIIKAFDEHRIFAAIDAPDKSRQGEDGLADHVFLYQTKSRVPEFNLPITPGRVIETDQGLIIIAPAEKVAFVLSLDLPADNGFDFGFLDSKYTVYRVGEGEGYKQLEDFRPPMGPLSESTSTYSGASRFEPLYSDWSLGGGGSGGCPGGGAGSTGCSFECGGMRCSVTCSNGRIPCCGCNSNNVPVCGCL